MTRRKESCQALKEAEHAGWISDIQRLHLAPQFSTPPQIYGLPKIHKPGTPLRPVSSIGSPTYILAKELASNFTLMGRSESFVKNEFAMEIRGTPIDDETTMVSFDVCKSNKSATARSHDSHLRLTTR